MSKKQIGGKTIYDVEGFAELFDLTDETVRDYIRGGKLPATKVGKRWWIQEETIQAWLDKKLPWQNNGGNDE